MQTLLGAEALRSVAAWGGAEALRGCRVRTTGGFAVAEHGGAPVPSPRVRSSSSCHRFSPTSAVSASPPSSLRLILMFVFAALPMYLSVVLWDSFRVIYRFPKYDL